MGSESLKCVSFREVKRNFSAYIRYLSLPMYISRKFSAYEFPMNIKKHGKFLFTMLFPQQSIFSLLFSQKPSFEG
jgi:hypothetical protein